MLFSAALFIACANTNNSEKSMGSPEEFEGENSIAQEDTTQHKVKITTSYGDVIVLLYNDTPKHRDNFLKLAERGFYDSLLFHRVMKNFMIQGGDPKSKDAKPGQRLGGNGPGYLVDSEFNPNHFHKRGALAAARKPDQVNPEKRSSGSQFYIVDGTTYTDVQLDNMEIQKSIQMKSGDFKFTEEQREIYKTVGGAAHLDGDYTVFGEVIEGMDVVDKIAAVQVDRAYRPIEDLRMTVTVIEE